MSYLRHSYLHITSVTRTSSVPMTWTSRKDYLSRSSSIDIECPEMFDAFFAALSSRSKLRWLTVTRIFTKLGSCVFVYSCLGCLSCTVNQLVSSMPILRCIASAWAAWVSENEGEKGRVRSSVWLFDTWFLTLCYLWNVPVGDFSECQSTLVLLHFPMSSKLPSP